MVEKESKPIGFKTRMKIPKVDLRSLFGRLLDPNEPWVITPEGSMFGIFDFVSCTISI